MALGEGRRPEDQRSSDYKQKLSCTQPLFVLSFLYEVIPPGDVTPLYEKPARQGAVPRSATPLPCFESAQQLKRLCREWQSSLPRPTTLSILTRVKLDSSSGRVRNGKVAHPAARVPSRPMGIRPQNALEASAPASLPNRCRARIQRGIEQGNNMHEIKSTAKLYYIASLLRF